MSTAVAPVPTVDVLSSPILEETLYEVVRGQRVELPAMSIMSLWLASRLQNRMGPFVEANAAGNVVTEGLFILDADQDIRRRPDVAFVSAQRWPVERLLPETGDWAVVPDLTVEVISPNDLYEAVVAKVGEYFHYSVRQVWLVIPLERQIHVYDSPRNVRILGDGDELTDTVVPGFRLWLSDLFGKAV
jgi:Uma2 family endonuclease